MHNSNTHIHRFQNRYPCSNDKAKPGDLYYGSTVKLNKVYLVFWSFSLQLPIFVFSSVKHPSNKHALTLLRVTLVSLLGNVFFKVKPLHS